MGTPDGRGEEWSADEVAYVGSAVRLPRVRRVVRKGASILRHLKQCRVRFEPRAISEVTVVS